MPKEYRPQRPSDQARAAAAAAARKFAGAPEKRLNIRVTGATQRAVRVAAVLAGKTEKRYVLEALRAQGVAIDPVDLPPLPGEE